MTAPLFLLYVDDDPDIRTIVEMALGLDPSITVRLMPSGAAALAFLRDSGWHPDVLMLDVMMPGMDGLETLRAVRDLPGFADIPAVLMTAKGRDVDLQLYRQNDVVGTILKPFDPLQLAIEVRALIDPVRNR